MFSYFRSALALVVVALLPAAAEASSLTFPQLSNVQFDSVVRELSADFSYTSVTPASSLGSVFGLEFGLTAGVTKVPAIEALVKQSGGGNGFPGYLPHAGGLLRVGVPLGITAELMMIPKVGSSNVSFKETGGAIEWTFSDVLLDDFFANMAIKGFYTRTSLDYSQTINNSTTQGLPVTGNIDFTDKIYGAQLIMSKKLLVFEPYIGLGYVRANGTLSVSAATPSATILGFSVPGESAATSAGSRPASSEFMAGLDIKLLILSIGAEYDRLYDCSSYSARLSFRF